MPTTVKKKKEGGGMSAGAMTFNYFICRPSTRIPLLYVKVPVHLSENTPRKMQGAIICIKLMEGD